MEMDICAQCLKPLERLEHGAYRQCCDGVAYWSKEKPLAMDSWWPVVRENGYTFYYSTKYKPELHRVQTPPKGDI